MKDESARDKAIESLVSDKLRAGATAGNGCPDAEIIAAYFERSLAPKERVRWEAHFDTCAQCQQRIAALVRMDEAGEASIAKPVAKVAPQPRKFSIFHLAWAAPVLLVVLVAGLWYTGEFDAVLKQKSETGNHAAVSSTPPQAQPKSANAPSPQQGVVAENQVAGLPTVTAKTSPASGTTSAKDEHAPQVSVPAESRTAGQVSPPPPPPPSPSNAKLDSEPRDNELKTASAANAPEGAPAQVQSLAMNGRNYASLLTVEQKQGSGAGKDLTSPSRAEATGNMRAKGEAQAAGEGSAVGGAAGESRDKAENVPAPTPPPPAVVAAEVGPRAAPGSFDSKAGLSAGLFKKAETSPSSAGTLKGFVKDPSGAIIPGATVLIINNRTNVARPITTNSSGEYIAEDLDPGVYTVEASKHGFKSSASKDVPLLARADRQLDFSLEVGEVAQAVTVEASAVRIQSASPHWRVGAHGLIQEQIGEGEWQTKPTGIAADLYAISFATREIGWAVGQNGTVLRSANGGESWGRVASPTDEDLIRVQATSAESAEVTAQSGVIFRTTDGAATWTRVEAAQ